MKLKGVFIIIREIVKFNGFLGFYRGYLIFFMIYVFSSVIWWFLYGMYIGLVGNIVLLGIFYMFVLVIVGLMVGFIIVIIINLLDIMRI